MESELPLEKLCEPLPFWDLFDCWHSHNPNSTLEEYVCLQRSIWLGAVKTWSDLKEVSALLWVKPSDGDRQQQLFDRTFTEYQKRLLAAAPPPVVEITENIKKQRQDELKTIIGQMPPLPLRKSALPEGDRQEAGAVKLPAQQRQLVNHRWKFVLEDLPISAMQVKETWQLWRQLQPLREQEFIDVERTVASVSPGGYIEEIIWQRDGVHKVNLLVLVDTGDNMLTYLPALEKLFEAIKRNRITPAQIYRFTGYPWRFLYGWQQPQKSVVVDFLLPQLHPDRTILLVVSDCGAALGREDPEREQGTLRFLQRWQGSVMPIIWLNPVSAERWVGTPAAAIQQQLRGWMLTLEQFNKSDIGRLLTAGGWV